MEKRLNILFDHLNNEDLLSEGTVQEMVEISHAVQEKDWDRALNLYNSMQTAKLDTEGTNWMVSASIPLDDMRLLTLSFPGRSQAPYQLRQGFEVV